MPSVPTEDDIVRERELFRYFQPSRNDDDNIAATPRQFLDGSVEDAIVQKAIESPDRTLTALAQLCACRLNTSRAMISVIGKETQYFIAEATRTVQLSDTRKSDNVDDGLWVGCTSVNKEGRLCEKTIELAPMPDKYPCFTVTDLSADERFRNLPFVTGPPNFRFYAGTCLTTKRGINIGSLFIIDDKVRPELTPSQVDFLGTVAGIVMRNLELNQEAEERRRSLKMSGALNAFQEGRISISNMAPTENVSPNHNPLMTSPNIRASSISVEDGSISMTSDGFYGFRETTRQEKQSVTDLAVASNDVHEPDLHSFGSSSEKLRQRRDQGLDPNSVFVRAASLLRQSLELHTTGGVVFLDSSVGSHGRELDTRSSAVADDNLLANSWEPMSPTNASVRSRTFEKKNNKVSDVIGFSTAEFALGYKPNMKEVTSFDPMDQSTLQGLLQSYPRGKLWSFDSDGVLSRWDEDLSSGSSPLPSDETALTHNQRKQTEATMLSKYFPKVRQLLFTPLWDSSTGRPVSGCFCFSTSPRQVYSAEVELSFLSTFCNTVMAEASRIAFMVAERKKGDFIGSISHELRSPLHGILASAEFLAETESDPFQNSLVDTISSCGRTLLDTVNHILDYSKINSYEKNWLTARKSRAQKSAVAMQNSAAVTGLDDKEAPPLMNIYATTDVAAVAEEVVEGVYAGQMYQDISSTDIAFMSSETIGKISERGTASERRDLRDSSRRVTKDVEVILDISRGDFVFTTQPGALRRIIMNLFGNSLKYTDKGVIVVSLTLSDLDDSSAHPHEALLEVSVKDTGKGISSEYLRSHLFTPFSQEDTLATGVGLGLSIVKSIVNMLNGTIDIESRVGVGTEVYVRIPLMRLPGTATTESTPSTVASSGSITTCMQGLHSDHCGKYAALYVGHNERATNNRNKDRTRVLHTYVTEWFGLKSASRSDPLDLIIVDERDLAELLSTHLRKYPTVVLCGASPLRSGSQLQNPPVMEFVSKPFGPYKLAKAVYTCLEKAKGNIDNEVDPTMTFPGESPVGSDADTIIPEVGAVNLSSQVSSRSPFSEHQSRNERPEFPFPADSPSPAVASPGPKTDGRGTDQRMMPDLVRRDSRRPPLTQRATEPMIEYKSIHTKTTATSSAVTKSGEVATSTAAQATAEIAEPIIAKQTELERRSLDSKKASASSCDNKDRPPRLLLVDDNKINLRLLETFMRKRKYSFVDSAENGQLAVNAAESSEESYDIIFMDISMPIMNGFEATRAIREIEHMRNAITQGPGNSESEKERRALIIALTGLASSRDQSEAFNSGVDLFLTKPVSFKEVGRILDNWEAQNGGGGSEVVPQALDKDKGST